LKTKIEWKDGAVWRSVSVNVAMSRKGNWFFKHDGKVYVFKEKRQGEQVLVLENGKWVKAGRITRGDIFLGQGLSYGEFCLTPEGLRSGQEALRNSPKGVVLRTQITGMGKRNETRTLDIHHS
jgi:hypothetical protein